MYKTLDKRSTRTIGVQPTGVSLVAFADATVEVTADWSRFDREFTTRLTRAVQTATRAASGIFDREGRNAGRSYFDAVADGFNPAGFARAGRQASNAFNRGWAGTDIDAGDLLDNNSAEFIVAGRRAGNAFERGFTSVDIDVDIDNNIFQRLTPQIANFGRAAGGAASSSGSLANALNNLVPGLGVLSTTMPTPQALGAVASGFGAIALSVTALIGVLAALASSAAFAIGGLIAAIPAIVGGAAVAIGALAIAFNGFGDAVSAGLSGDLEKFNEELAGLSPNARAAAQAIVSMKPAFDQIKNTVQENLFQGLGEQIAALGQTYLPIAEQALGRFSTTFNTIIQDIFSTLQQTDVAANFSAGFDSLANAFDRLGQAAGPLTQAFSQLFVSSGPFVERLADGIARAAESFASWIDDAQRSGALDNFFERAFEALAGISRVVGGVSRALGAIFSAGEGTGTDILNSMADALDRVADFLSSPEGRAGLQEFFETSRRALAGMMQALGPFLQAIGALAGPLFKTFADNAEQLGPVFGDWLTAMLPIIAALGLVLSAFVRLQAFLLTFLASIRGLVTFFSDVATAIIGFFTTIPTFATNFITTIVSFFSQLPGQIIIGIQALPGLLFQFFTDALVFVIGAVATGIANILVFFLELPFTIANALASLPQTLFDFFTTVFNFAGSAISNGISFVVGLVASLPGLMLGALAALPGMLWNFFYNAFLGVAGAIRSGVQSAIDFVRGLPNQLVSAVSSLGSRLMDAIRGPVNRVVDAANRLIDSINRLPGPDISRIPRLANGAIVRGGAMTAVIGEAGPEVVIPLTRPTRARQLVEQSGLLQIIGADNERGGGITNQNTTVVNAPINVVSNAQDPETVAYKTVARLSRLALV